MYCMNLTSFLSVYVLYEFDIMFDVYVLYELDIIFECLCIV